MTFTELLEGQWRLNSHLSRKPTREELELAIIDEIGELTKALKWGADTPIPYEGWAWWQREDKSRSSAEEVLGECVDIMHFLLSEIVLHSDWLTDEDVAYLTDVYPKWWQEGYESLEFSLWQLSGSKYRRFSQHCLVWVMLSLGFTRDDFNAAWHKSVEKNLRRWG